jgi:predicted transport protein
MTLGMEQAPSLREAFEDLKELRAEPVYPFLLEVYADYERSLLQEKEFAEIVRLLESYVFRRLVCAIPANSLLKTFATFARRIDRTRYLESVKAQFTVMRSYRRFPTDDEFEQDIQTRDLYNFRGRNYWLRRLENHGRKERIAVENYTIEHILPQNPNLNAQWRVDLGPEWKKTQNRWLHTLGNLTLTGYNAEYSDRSFAEKRDLEGGFAQSPLRVNEGIGSLDSWNEDAIKTRAQRLARKAVDVWQSRFLDGETLRAHEPEKKRPGNSTPEYLTLLDKPEVKTLLDALRSAIAEVHPDVDENQRKQVVVFRKRRRIVCVIPQRDRLKLILNLRFDEVDDPEGLCQDLTGIGHWGTGDVGVILSKASDCSKILPLVRQAYDKWNSGG